MSVQATPLVATNGSAVAGVNLEVATIPAGPNGRYNWIGNLMRQLHEALRELGFDKAL